MALIGRSALDLYGILFLFLLVISARFPAKGEPESPADEAKSPSVKECRVHIEAALEKYWEDQEPESEDQEQVEGKTETEKENLKDNPPADLPQANETDEETDDETEEEDDGADEDLGKEEENDEDEDDDEEQEDDDDGVDSGEGTKGEDDEDKNESNDDNETEGDGSDEVDNDEEDEEDDDEDENDEETVENEKEKDIGTEETAEDEEDDDDDDDEDEDDDEATEQKEDQEEVRREEEENEEEGEEQEEGEEEETSPTESEDTKQTEAENDDDDEDEDEREDDEDEGEDDEEVDEVTGAETTPEDEAQNDSDDTDAKQEKEDNDEEEEEDDDDDDDEATGEPDSASTGVAPELSDAGPTSEQPKATSDEKKETVEEDKPEETEEEMDAEEEEEDEEEVDEEDELLESIYEEEEDEEEEEEDFLTMTKAPFRTRDHIDAILELDEVGTDYDKEGDKLALSIFKEIKKIQETNVKPMEMIYKYGDSTTRLLGDAEIFSKPMVLFLGPWNSGKTTIINYLLGIERTPTALKTGTGITDVDFTVVTHGDQRQVTSGTELAADWTYASLQKFGQGFLDHFRGITIPHTLLKKIILVDTPGVLENRKNTERGYPFNDAFQWFIDRADAIFVVLDPTKVDIGGELGSVVDQLKGRDVRFILNKADTIRRMDLMRVVGQLFWNLSPLMSSAEAPVIYAVSLMTKPFHPSAPAKFLIDQEKNFLYDLREVMDKRVENKILYARRHAVRVRNHAKMVDCYLSTFYRTKSIFSNKKNVAKLITENPADYNIYEGLGSMTNVSRYDLPDPVTYKDFFKLHPLYDFKPLASTCSYFRGCPMDKLDSAIGNDLPELFAKYKKAKSNITLVRQEGR